jgi:hypothetical protein
MIISSQKEFEGIVDIYRLDTQGHVEEVMIRCVDDTRYIPLLTSVGESLIFHLNQQVHIKGYILGNDFNNNPIVRIEELIFD